MVVISKKGCHATDKESNEKKHSLFLNPQSSSTVSSTTSSLCPMFLTHLLIAMRPSHQVTPNLVALQATHVHNLDDIKSPPGHAPTPTQLI
jgi:hypothetical protein